MPTVANNTFNSKTHASLDYRRRRVEPIFRAALQEWMSFIIKQIQNDFRTKFQKDIVGEVTDWEFLQDKGEEIMKPATLTVMKSGGDASYQLMQAESSFDVLNPSSVRAAKRYTAKLVREVNSETKKGLRLAVSTGIKNGKSMAQISREMRPLVGLTKTQVQSVLNFESRLQDKDKFPNLTATDIEKKTQRYANKTHLRRTRTIARTETARAQNLGVASGMEDLGVAELEFNATLDDKTSPECIALDGKIFPVKEAVGIIPVHPNCLSGDSLVSPCGDVTGASKRWYDGDMFVIETSLGDKLICTPNHSISTSDGFVSANKLDIGSKVICNSISERERIGNRDDVKKPALIKDITDSFFRDSKAVSVPVPMTPEDFHGDGIGSNVAVIASNRFLGNSANTSFFKHLDKFNLMYGNIRRFLFDCFSMFAFGFPRNNPAFSGFMSRSGLSEAGCFGHSTPFERFCFTLRSKPDIGSDKSICNCPPTHRKPFREFVYGHSFFVKLLDFAYRQKNKRLPGKILSGIGSRFCLADIVHIKSFHFSDYVYNIETTELYYISDNIASHNCRCSMLPVIDDTPMCRSSKSAACVIPGELKQTQVDSLLKQLTKVTGGEALKIRRAIRKLGYKGGLKGAEPGALVPPIAPTKVPQAARPILIKPKPAGDNV